MAHFMFRAQIISKTNQSAVAASAYRSGESLYSDRDGLTKNFGERDVSPESYILSPENAPEWANNREQLWNEVEKKEKQHNSQLAREIVMALPKQLTNEEQTNLMLDYSKENFSDEGMVADISIHRDKEHNPHAHVMLTLRPFQEDGEWGQKAKKEYILDENGDFTYTNKGNKRSRKVDSVDWNTEERLETWRKNFADKINEKFQEKGIEDHVSHESYEKQGIETIPKIRLSRDAYQYEKRIEKEANSKGKDYEAVTYYGKLNKEIHDINQELKSYKNEEKVVSFEEQKQEIKKDENFESIRKNAALGYAEKASLTMVAKRAKTYVDYDVASNIYQEISEGNWKKKLDQQKLQIQAEKNVINKVNHVFQKNPKNVIEYGFAPKAKEYGEQMKERIQQTQTLISNYENEKTKFNTVLMKAELALEVQKRLTKDEFQHLHPNAKQEYSSREMYVAVQHFKDTGKLLSEDSIKQTAEEQKERSNAPSINKQTNNISKSLFILNRAIKKQQKEKIRSLENKDLDQAYQANNKIEQYTLRKNTLSKELEGNTAFLKAELGNRYSDQSLERISNPETVLKLHSMYQEGTTTGNLQKDIASLYQQQKAEQTKLTTQNQNQQVGKEYTSQLANGLLQSLDAIQRANEENKQRTDPKSKSKRKRGRHEKNNELEM